jgi:hypothetical protein
MSKVIKLSAVIVITIFFSLIFLPAQLYWKLLDGQALGLEYVSASGSILNSEFTGVTLNGQWLGNVTVQPKWSSLLLIINHPSVHILIEKKYSRTHAYENIDVSIYNLELFEGVSTTGDIGVYINRLELMGSACLIEGVSIDTDDFMLRALGVSRSPTLILSNYTCGPDNFFIELDVMDQDVLMGNITFELNDLQSAVISFSLDSGYVSELLSFQIDLPPIEFTINF